jgi:hypothetical protein
VSLSQRLKEAAQERRISAGLPPEPDPAPTDAAGADPTADPAVVDLSDPAGDDVVIDLTQVLARDLGPTGVAYDPVRDGDATRSFDGDDSSLLTGNQAAADPCPRCGGRTQIDLIDQVHQTVSLSCLSCFHMFRVEQHT